MMINKKTSRLRRAKTARSRIRKLAVPRLSVHRSGQHIYAQVIAADGATVVAAASTVQKGIRGDLKGTKNKSAAATVGRVVAEKARAAGVESVAFDRSGFRYHGRVAALADAAREAGLKF
ncbi:MAG: 50S ribosomal protein L18 [Rhodanobacteraceae bacterium]